VGTIKFDSLPIYEVLILFFNAKNSSAVTTEIAEPSPQRRRQVPLFFFHVFPRHSPRICHRLWESHPRPKWTAPRSCEGRTSRAERKSFSSSARRGARQSPPDFPKRQSEAPSRRRRQAAENTRSAGFPPPRGSGFPGLRANRAPFLRSLRSLRNARRWRSPLQSPPNASAYRCIYRQQKNTAGFRQILAENFKKYAEF